MHRMKAKKLKRIGGGGWVERKDEIHLIVFCYSLWKVDVFQGITLPDAPRFGKVFGGQMVGQV